MCGNEDEKVTKRRRGRSGEEKHKNGREQQQQYPQKPLIPLLLSSRLFLCLSPFSSPSSFPFPCFSLTFLCLDITIIIVIHLIIFISTNHYFVPITCYGVMTLSVCKVSILGRKSLERKRKHIDNYFLL